jgi:hypothetical protein
MSASAEDEARQYVDGAKSRKVILVKKKKAGGAYAWCCVSDR